LAATYNIERYGKQKTTMWEGINKVQKEPKN